MEDNPKRIKLYDGKTSRPERPKSPEKMLVAADRYGGFKSAGCDRRVSGGGSPATASVTQASALIDKFYRGKEAGEAIPKKKKKNWLGINKTKNDLTDNLVEDHRVGVYEPVVAAPPTKRPDPVLIKSPERVKRMGTDQDRQLLKRLEKTKLYTVIHARNPARVLAPNPGATTRSLVDLQVGMLWGLKSGRALLNRFPHFQTRVASTAEKLYLEQSGLGARLYEDMMREGVDVSWCKTSKNGRAVDLGAVDVLFLREDQVRREIGHVRGMCGVETGEFEGGVEVDMGVLGRGKEGGEDGEGYVHKIMRGVRA